MPGFAEVPRGVENLMVAPVTGAANTVGTWVDVPGIGSFEVNVESDSDELSGDNRIIAVSKSAPSLSGSMEWHQINLAALAVVKGGIVSTTGTAGNQISELPESDTLTQINFAIQVAAPGVDVGGSEYQVEVKKATITSGLSESMTTDDWNTPSLDYAGVSVGGILLVRRQFEDADNGGLPYEAA